MESVAENKGFESLKFYLNYYCERIHNQFTNLPIRLTNTKCKRNYV